MKSVWGAHVRTQEEDDLSEECVCEPPQACLSCHRPPEMVEPDLLYAYQGLRDTTKDEELVEDHLRASVTQGASNLHSDEDMEDKMNAQELLAFITPQGRVFKWKVMPFGVANAPALFQELMNKILSILRQRPKVQELISRGAQKEAHIDDVCLGTNTQEDHLILLGEFFAVCQENHTRLKLETCQFMQETMQYLGFDVGYGWWTAAASKAKPLIHAKVRHEDAKKGLHDVRSFIGVCNFYRHHINNFTYTSAILTDLIKKSTTWSKKESLPCLSWRA